MNVGELKALLENLPDEMMIVMSSDSEGNNYSPLDFAYEDEYYIADSSYSGEMAMAESDWESEKDYVDGETYQEYLKESGAVQCLLLVPVN